MTVTRAIDSPVVIGIQFLNSRKRNKYQVCPTRRLGQSSHMREKDRSERSRKRERKVEEVQFLITQIQVLTMASTHSHLVHLISFCSNSISSRLSVKGDSFEHCTLQQAFHILHPHIKALPSVQAACTCCRCCCC